MKTKHILSGLLFALVCMAILTSGCKKLALQKNFSRSTDDTIDAHLYKTAWQYMLSRSKGADTIFKTMHDAIIYSGVDTNLYSQQGNTYIFLNTNACKSLWKAYTVAGKAATSFRSYAPADLKNYFLYLIVKGTYTHYNLPIYPVTVQTMAPPGAFTNNSPSFLIPTPTGVVSSTFQSNPNSTMTMYVLDALIGNTQSFPLVINMSIENTTTLNANTTVSTSDLLATNGVVDVMNGPPYPITF